jgi:hypothetical protein
VRISLALGLIAGTFAAAQPPRDSLRQSPTLAGIVVEVDRGPAGQFSIRAQSDEVVRYLFDANTAVSRDQKKVRPDALLPGDRVEVETAPLPGSQIRLARAVRVVELSPNAHPSRTRPAPYHPDAYLSEADRILLNRGNLLMTGVVSRLDDGALVLRTRDRGEQTLRLRGDTKYLERGARAQASDLKPDMRVFVRAGRDLFGAPEVYEVAWGTILQPR